MEAQARISIDVEPGEDLGYCTNRFFEAVAEGAVEALNKSYGRRVGVTFSVAPEPVERMA